MSTPIRVLLADDTDDVRAILRTALSADERFVVVGEARNGLQAVEMAGAARPDAVVLDLAMPVMDGLQAAPQILERAPGCKIVVLSGFEAARMTERAHAAGAHRYLEKGVALAGIANVLAEVCDVDAMVDVTLPAGRSTLTKLRQADEFRRTLLAAVSHDLRTPLTVIQGFSKTLQRNLDDFTRPELLDMVSRIALNADRLERILRNLLDLERLDGGAVLATLQTVDVCRVAGRVVDALGPEGRSQITVQGAGIEAVADEGLLERALDNLISNALRHTAPGTPVWVRAEVAGSEVQIAVEDAGPGISSQARDAIFEPFQRAMSDRTGSGIGLSIVKRFLGLMGGRITVTDREGGGARFVVTLSSARPAAPMLHARAAGA